MADKNIGTCPKRIVTLCGFPGAGKTLIGKALSAPETAGRQISYNFIDLDELIEQEQKMSVGQLFAEQGEVAFREIEKETLKRVLNARNTGEAGKILLISLGGGTLLDAQSRELVKRKTLCIYLTCSTEALEWRLSLPEQAAQRPMIQALLKTGSLHSWISQTLALREPLYLQCAHAQIDTADWDPERIISQIEKVILRNII